ncbi:MAG: hypothetical protein ACK57B_03350 [Betaproteobacteria bacterium]
MSLDLHLRIADAVTLVQAPVMAHVMARNTGTGSELLPSGLGRPETLVIVLSRPDGEVLQRVPSSGPSRRDRPQAAPRLEPLGPGATVGWHLDLAGVLDLAQPGEYRIHAELRDPDRGLRSTSPAVPITALPNRCGSFDLLRSRVALDMTYVLQPCSDGSALLSFRSSTALDQTRKRVRLSLPAGVDARIAETDYSSLESFTDDYTRAVVWLAGGSLHRQMVSADSALPPLDSVPVVEGLRLVGHPVQQRNGALLAVTADRSGRLQSRAFDASLTPTEVRDLGTVSEQELIEIASAPGGQLWVLRAERMSTQVRATLYRPGGPSVDAVLLPQDATSGRSLWLGLRAETGVPWASAPRLLAAQLVERRHDTGAQALLRLWSIPLSDGQPGEPKAVDAPIDRSVLQPGESFVSAQVARAGQFVYALLLTSRGRLLFSTGGQAPTPMLDLPDTAAQGARLSPDVAGTAWVFWPTPEAGVAAELIFQPPQK